VVAFLGCFQKPNTFHPGHRGGTLSNVNHHSFHQRLLRQKHDCDSHLSKLGITSLSMAMKVNIRIVGRKSSEPWLEGGVEMYETRLKPSNLQVETTWHKDNSALIKGVDMDRSKNHCVVCLDPNGLQTTSEVFCDKLYEWLEDGGSRLSFIIGGAEGLPNELKYTSYSSSGKQSQPPPMISLSTLTFTHQFARLLLIEQIYRATEIRKVGTRKTNNFFFILYFVIYLSSITAYVFVLFFW